MALEICQSRYIIIMVISLSFSNDLTCLCMTGCIDGLLPAAKLQMRSSLQVSSALKQKRYILNQDFLML